MRYSTTISVKIDWKLCFSRLNLNNYALVCQFHAEICIKNPTSTQIWLFVSVKFCDFWTTIFIKIKWKLCFSRLNWDNYALVYSFHAEICIKNPNSTQIWLFVSVKFCDIWQLYLSKKNENYAFLGLIWTIKLYLVHFTQK